MTAWGWIDAPAEGCVLGAEDLRLEGWATWDEGAARGVVVFLDGVPLGAAPTGVARADVARELGLSGAELAGFGFEVTAAQLRSVALAAGPPERIATLSLAALGPEGSETVAQVERSIHLKIPPPKEGAWVLGHLDRPVRGVPVLPGQVEVAGWAVVNGEPAIATIVHVNGRLAAFGVVDALRKDAGDYLGASKLAPSGFRCLLDTEALEDEPANELEVVVSAMGRLIPEAGLFTSSVLEFDRLMVEIDRVTTRMECWIDSPGEHALLDRAAVRVIGWALTSSGPVAEVEIRVNGASHGLARLGIPRPDLASVRTSHYAPVAGFEHVVDLSKVAPEELEVTIEAVITDLSGSRQHTTSRSCRLARPVGTPPRRDPAAPRRETPARIAQLRSSTLTPPSEVASASTGRLNLLVVTHELGLGGGQLWLSELLERSGAGREFDCTVLSQKGGALQTDLERLGVNVHVTSAFPVDDADSYAGRIAEAAMLASKWRVNAVLANTMSSFAGADLAARLGLPCVWAIHESFAPSMYWSFAYAPDSVDPLVRQRVEELLARTPAVVFEAEATRQLYLELVPTQHALLVPYGINTAQIDAYLSTMTRDEARRRHDLAPGQRVLLVMGTTEPRKSQTVLAEAFAEVAAEHPEALLVFVGDTGTTYSRSLRRLVEASGTAGQIRLEPVTADIYSWYRAADILVSASDIESLPRSFLEAMCFGLPVTAASVFGVPDLIEDGRTGFLFRARDLRAMVDAVRRVLSADSETLAAIAVSAQAHVRAHYDSAGYSELLISLLKEQITPAVGSGNAREG